MWNELTTTGEPAVGLFGLMVKTDWQPHSALADGNGDGTGDLAGVRTHLAYLEDLGVDAVWFTPWYLSPLGDGGYDVADDRVIDPAFGAIEEADALIAEAAALNLRTILDIVPNHVSDQHVWFRAALKAGPGSPERSWFHPGEGDDGSQIPTRWVSSFQAGTWTRTTSADGTPGEWYLHLFTPLQPDVNWNHHEVRQGDELGLPENEDLPRGAIQDPMHFRSGGVDPGRDGCRVPLRWMSDPACAHGFSAPRPDGTRAEPWLPEPDWWGRYAVDTQAADPASMLSLHRAAIATRRSESGLRDAAFAWLEISGAGNHVLAFSRGDVACVVNFGAEPASLPQHSAVLLASGDLLDGRLPTDTAVWLRL